MFFLLFWCVELMKPVAGSPRIEHSRTAIPIPYHPLRDDSDGLNALLRSLGNARIVLLGEASHGTSEFQQWRARITERLINQKEFRYVVTEADFNEMLPVNDFVRGNANKMDSPLKILSVFRRWPQWMWANEEFAQFITWLNAFNQLKSRKEKVSLYGFDLYGVGPSIDSVKNREKNPSIIELLKKVELCFKPYWDDAIKYSTSIHNHLPDCSETMEGLKQKASSEINKKIKSEDEFISLQYFLTALDGEQYFRILAQNQSAAWNIRDRHMAATIDRLIELCGRDAKIIVWAHNAHVGDAMYTDMPQMGRTNLCQLLKRKYGDDKIFSVGFGMYSGDVMAAYKWSDSARVISLPPAYDGSWESLLKQAGEGDKLIFSEEMQKVMPLNRWYNQRGIGVIYHPDRPRSSYMPSYISKKYDAFIFIDNTHPIHPIQKRD